MRCNLKGLLTNSLDCISPKKDRYNIARSGLEQVIEHIEMVRTGKATLEEFGEFYCLIEKSPQG